MDNISTQFLAEGVASFCTLVATVLSSYLIYLHVQNWTKPVQQQSIILIIGMVPIFAIDSLISMIELNAPEWFLTSLDSFKEIYEAVVIYQFLLLMYAYMDIDPAKQVPDNLKGRELHQSFPFNFFMNDMIVSKESLSTLRWWALQFVILRPIISVIAVVLEIYDLYSYFYLPISIILNISITLAVYALMLFYHAFHHELEPHRPLPQFLSIKGVVFFAFWQGCILELLVFYGVVHADHWYTAKEISSAIQNFLVCVEMGLIFAPVNFYAFSHHEFIFNASAPVTKVSTVETKVTKRGNKKKD